MTWNWIKSENVDKIKLSCIFYSGDRMKLIAHRGNTSDNYGENTKEAILSALEKNYIAGIETDVRMTYDQKFVLNHNVTIDHTSNGRGFVALMSLKELQKYQFGTTEHPTKIAVLEDVLKAIHSDKLILLELKHETDLYDIYLKKLTKLLHKFSHLNVYLCSFHYDLILKMKTMNPKIPCGLIIGPLLNQNKDYNAFDFLAIEQHLRLPNTKKELFLWTVNKTIPNESVSYLITDKPEKLAKELGDLR